MTDPTTQLEAVSLRIADETVVESAQFAWWIPMVGVLTACALVMTLRYAKRTFRWNSLSERSAWSRIARASDLTAKQRRSLESVCAAASIDPCVVALCPSVTERLVLICAGTPERESILAAIRKLHPSINSIEFGAQSALQADVDVCA